MTSPHGRSEESCDLRIRQRGSGICVSLLTGGGDRPYAFGLTTALAAGGAELDLIANDELDCPELRNEYAVNFFNLRGDQRPDASLVRKVLRVATYYARLIRYAATAKPRLFHILWNNKFEMFDRTLLTLYYRVLGKRIVLTLHNVNAGVRDATDTALNRMTLRFQYGLADHMFVHTDKMKQELVNDFGQSLDRISVIPFGINNSVPNTPLAAREARNHLGIREGEKAILFFGNIAPYKGLEYLVAAFRKAACQRTDYRLIIAGRPKNCESYWSSIREDIREDVEAGRILLRSEFIPDEETEIYFKAADVLVLPYTHIYQSGVLFLGYSFGLPVLVSDVGFLKNEVVEGQTGFVFQPQDEDDLATAIDRYFGSDLYKNLDHHRPEITAYALEHHSWDLVAQITMKKYADLLQLRAAEPCAIASSRTSS
jgi:glycosyltransferase involved in cell wall biosynthesis